MTPLPKRKLSRARQGKRRASIKLTLATLVSCAKCKTKIKSHTVCKNCGSYNGKTVVVRKNETSVKKSSPTK